MAGNRTLTIIKPDAFNAGKAGLIIAHLEKAGFKVIASRVMRLTETQAQKNLRDVLSNLRRLIEPYVQISRQAVGLALDTILVDSCQFEALLEKVDYLPGTAGLAVLRDALALYRGDFLSGVSVADASAFEELFASHGLTEWVFTTKK